MSMYIGFNRLTIQPLDTSFAKAGDPIVIQGDANKGATVKAEISGISKDAVTVSGSNIGYYISRKGVGEVKVAFDLLDIQNDDQTRILGREKSTAGVQYTGEDTEAPFCSILMESEDGQGNTALVGMFYGVFSQDGETLNTKEEGSTFTPDAESYTYTASASKQTGTKGKYMAKYAGDDQTAIAELRNNILLENSTTSTSQG